MNDFKGKLLIGTFRESRDKCTPLRVYDRIVHSQVRTSTLGQACRATQPHWAPKARLDPEIPPEYTPCQDEILSVHTKPGLD